MDIWQTYNTIMRRLLVCGATSTVAGVPLLFLGPFWQGVGLEAIAWGVIDAGIALVGSWITRRRRARLPDPLALEVMARKARVLRRILLINTGLDVLYVTGGAALALMLGAHDPFLRGNGWGIVIQGGFLFLFDLLHTLGVPGPESARG